MGMTFLQLAQKVIAEQKYPMTIGQIWEVAQSKGYDAEVGSKGATPSATLAAQLYVDVRDNPKSTFVSVGARPKRFYLRSLGEPAPETTLPAEPETPLAQSMQAPYLEKALHPFLAYYAYYYLHASVKTIHHSKSDKKEFGEWVHPDIVGCYFPFGDWEKEVVEVSSLLGNPAVKLFSFELKRALSFSNLREAFFQAVSNSSWANEGYLVAADIDPDQDLRSELKRLSAAFGIGVIELNVAEPDSSGVLIPARAKEAVDWETVNKLAGMNPDFRAFLQRIKKDIESREVRTELYDKVLEKEALVATINQLPSVAKVSMSVSKKGPIK